MVSGKHDLKGKQLGVADHGLDNVSTGISVAIKIDIERDVTFLHCRITDELWTGAHNSHYFQLIYFLHFIIHVLILS